MDCQAVVSSTLGVRRHLASSGSISRRRSSTVMCLPPGQACQAVLEFMQRHPIAATWGRSDLASSDWHTPVHGGRVLAERCLRKWAENDRTTNSTTAEIASKRRRWLHDAVVEGSVTEEKAILDRLDQTEVVDWPAVDGAEAKPLPISVLILRGGIEGNRT
jgi:hypothetical protein